jgi:hypothetical protein
MPNRYSAEPAIRGGTVEPCSPGQALCRLAAASAIFFFGLGINLFEAVQQSDRAFGVTNEAGKNRKLVERTSVEWLH